MTRASVAVVAFAVLAALAGCREEPTIVIKFEPNDMTAKRPADLATAAARDLGTAATATAPTAMASGKATKPKGGECKTAADCVVVPLECCDCANGGKQHAIAKKHAAAAKAARAEKCKAAVCTMMLSTDPSCGQRPDCVDGACVMVKK